MTDYSLGHGPAMMKRFKDRAVADGTRFIEPLLPCQGLIVDVGCGSGALAHWIAEHNKNLSVIAVDHQLHQLIDYLPQKQKNLSFVEASAYHLPLQSNSVDLLYLHAVCMYLNPIEPVLAQAARVLKHGGKIALRNGLSVINNMELFVDGQILANVLNHNLDKNGDDPRIALTLPTQLESLGFEGLQTKTTVETSKTQTEIKEVADASIELFEGNMGQLAIDDSIASASELNQLINGIKQWAQSDKAYNRAIWLEHIFVLK